MIIAGRLVLASEVDLVPVHALPRETRDRFAHGDGDVVVSRAHARDVSRVIDASAAALLSCFRVPRTVADAVIEYSRSAGADPETVLAGAWPLLSRLVDDRLLVPDGDRAAAPIEPALAPGSRVDDWSVVRAVYLMDDTEVHQVRDDAGRWRALKLDRAPAADGGAGGLDHEAAVLAGLDGTVAPRLCGRGRTGERPYLVLEWRAGASVDVVAAECRALPEPDRERALLAVALSVLDAYAALHAQGVLHGDPHPRNVLVDGRGRVSVLDFALARRQGDGPEVPRAGVPFYLEPELTRAIHDGAPLPPATDRGEQFAVAALVYAVVAGAHYRDFPLDKQAFLRAVCEDPPLPFASRGARPWPAMERVLGRALSKAPGDRYPSVAALAADLRRATAVAPAPGGMGATGSGARSAQPPSDSARALLDGVLARAGVGAREPPRPVGEPPTASVMHGAAGLAYVLYRIALARQSPDVLALADLWASRARAAAAQTDAFADAARGLTHHAYRAASPYHGVSGVHWVSALIAHAVGEAAGVARSVDAFIRATPVPTAGADADLMLGDAGALIAAAALLDTLDGSHAGPRGQLAAHGDALSAALWGTVGTYAPIPECTQLPTAGAAHGWAGLLHATLRWNAVTGAPLSDPVRRRLGELAASAEPWGRGLRWPHTLAGDVPERRTYLAGWCNGTAGLVHLWTAAAASTGDDSFTELAAGAAWSTWEHMSEGSGDLCCGTAGAAVALLAHHRATGDRAWLQRAAVLADHAARQMMEASPARPDSLYHGRPGVALLIATLDRPERAVMPLFGAER